MKLLKINNLSLGYEKKKIIKNLSFDIVENDYLCIIGENGIGKSTLLKGLLGLLKPMSGTVEKQIDSTEIGYLPQLNTNKVDFPASIYEIILSGTVNTLNFWPFYGKKQKNMAQKIMEELKITHLKKQSFQELSGGLMQRVLIARTLVVPKKMLILDEPTSGLDPDVTKQLYELIKKLHMEGLTIVMITHDMNSPIKDATKIMHLKENDMFFGTKEEFERGIQK